MDDGPLSGLPDFDFDPSEPSAANPPPGRGAQPRTDAAGPEPASGGEDLLDFELELDDLAPGGTPAEGELVNEIRDFFTVLVKTIRTAQLYVHGNPLLNQFVAELESRLGRLWEQLPTVVVSIFENDIVWDERPVYSGKSGGQENLAFQLYRDGIRRLEFEPGVEKNELLRFIDVLRLAKRLKEDEDDLLTLLWSSDFEHIRYEYVDVLGDDPPLPRSGVEVEENAQLPALPELELQPELETPTLREDFEPSLYFLDEAELAQMQQELQREWERTVKRDVMLAVLDQYEMGDAERRLEILGILRQLLPRFLADGEFGSAAFIVSELQAIVKKRADPDVSGQVDEIVGELSQPLVVDQLVRILEDGSIDMNSEDLATLLNALRPEAIQVLIQALPTLTRKEALGKLNETLERLAALSPGLVANLVRSDDPRTAASAAGLAARLRLSGTADALAELVKRQDPRVRLAGVEGLVALQSTVGGGPLLEALEDESRDVRVAAARGLAELRYSPGAVQLEKHVTGSELQRRDLTEQLAFFEAYARAAGTRGVKLLGRMLNGRRALWRKYPSRVRACAARALGLVGGPEAQQALQAAGRDRDPMVLSAVHAATRARASGGE